MSVMNGRPPTLMRNIACDERGAVLVEVSIVMTIMLVFLLGAIEFLFVFYQRNAAAKAVQIGVRIAAVSEPVGRGLNRLSADALGQRVPQGTAMPDFVVTCDGSASRCTCSSGACPSDLAYNAAAMNTIVFGRGSSSCGDEMGQERTHAPQQRP
jgi:Flp pilus assembly protein TadG